MSDKDCDCKEGECKCGSECACGCNCDCDCCHDGHHFQRRFQTRAEQVEALEAYLAELRLEVQAVEERLAGLKK
ncbi:MAG: hypothetical protein FD146_2461 [Anaerolineaceae bacterium]|nr:MAG: hypothetical protein FD146_2461 [Anaerolineaceae bacterium]